RSGPIEKAHPFADKRLPGAVGGMRFACDDELYGALGIIEELQQALGVMQKQIGPLVDGEAPGKTQSQCPSIENLLCRLDCFGWRSGCCALGGEALANIIDQHRPVGSAKLPQRGVVDTA